MSKINQDLASLFTKFGQNLLADESNGMVEIKSEADLAGLSSSMKNGYANAAKDRKLDGSWVISNTRSSVEPFLTYSEIVLCVKRYGRCLLTVVTMEMIMITIKLSHRY